MVFLEKLLGIDVGSQASPNAQNEPQTPVTVPDVPIPASETPTEPATIPPMKDSFLTTIYPWTSQKANYHNVGVIADRVGLSASQKLILRGCIYQESTFWNVLPNGKPVTNINHFKDGSISKDFGIAQVNDYWNIGPGKPFPSVQYVVDHPEEVITWMARIYKRTNALKPWASYTSRAYQQWITNGSPMWKLATTSADQL